MAGWRASRFLCTTKPTSVNDPWSGLGVAHASKGQREILETRAAGLFFLMNFSDFVDSFTKLRLLSLHWEMFFGANTTVLNLTVLVKRLWDVLYVLPRTWEIYSVIYVWMQMGVRWREIQRNRERLWISSKSQNSLKLQFQKLFPGPQRWRSAHCRKWNHCQAVCLLYHYSIRASPFQQNCISQTGCTST